MKRPRLFLSLFIIALSFFLHSGLSLAARPLSLEEALDIALKDNPQVRAVMSELKMSEAQKVQARSAFFPRLDVEEGFIRSDNPVMVFMEKLNQELFSQSDFRIQNLNDPSPRTDWATRLVLTQPIFNRGKEYIGNELSKKAYEITALRQKAVKQYVAFRVESAYLKTLLAIQRRKVMTRAVDTARQGYELARNRYLAGTALKSDMLAAEARLMRLKHELATAKAEEKTAMSELNSIMSRPQNEVWELDQGVLLEKGATRPLEAWIKLAKERRPEVAISDKFVELALLKKKGAKLNFLPSLNLQGDYELHGEDPFSDDGESWSIMAKASFNIFKGLGDKARLVEASADVERARAQRQRVLNETELEVRSAYHANIAAEEALRSAKSEVERAKEALRILRRRYTQGLALMVEVLGAEDALKYAELGLEDARFRQRLSELKLKLFSGTLLTSEERVEEAE